MYRMSRLLSKIEWQLVDEPKGRDLFLAALFLFMSCFAVGIPLLGLYRRPESVPGDLVPLALVRQRSLRGRSSWLCQADASSAREPVAFAAVTVLSLLLVLLFRYRVEGAAVTARERPVVTRG